MLFCVEFLDDSLLSPEIFWAFELRVDARQHDVGGNELRLLGNHLLEQFRSRLPLPPRLMDLGHQVLYAQIGLIQLERLLKQGSRLIEAAVLMVELA